MIEATALIPPLNLICRTGTPYRPPSVSIAERAPSLARTFSYLSPASKMRDGAFVVVKGRVLPVGLACQTAPGAGSVGGDSRNDAAFPEAARLLARGDAGAFRLVLIGRHAGPWQAGSWNAVSKMLFTWFGGRSG